MIVVSSLTVRCPACGAPAGERCSNGAPHRARQPHRVRIALAYRDAGEPLSARMLATLRGWGLSSAPGLLLALALLLGGCGAEVAQMPADAGVDAAAPSPVRDPRAKQGTKDWVYCTDDDGGPGLCEP